MSRFSHIDADGKAAMVDVSRKAPQKRTAKASGKIKLAVETVALIRENNIKKGDVLTVAQIAGIQAAKQAAFLIPLCHPLALTKVKVAASLEEDGVVVHGEVSCVDKTGVEMEALTAVSVALLTVYDMCKAVDKSMLMGDITLLEKTKEDLEG
jgi:cyclic pyranopterin phosphate synthase